MEILMTLASLQKILRENWFQEVAPGTLRRWTFEQRLSELTEAELGQLIKIYCQTLHQVPPRQPEILKIVTAVKAGREYHKRGVRISREVLCKFIHALTLAEYRLDALLLHPPTMRRREFQEYAAELGMDPSRLAQIYFAWHGEIRKLTTP